MNKTLRGIREIGWKDYRTSVRVYVVVEGDALIVLHIDPQKRRTAMEKGTVKLLEQRRRDVCAK